MIISGRKIICRTFIALCFLPFLFSCSRNSNKKSFISSLDDVDALINQHLYAEAVQELSKIEKNAYGSWSQLGIFRRYRQCDENEKAEKYLSKVLKKNPENLELIAVYSNFLLRQNKISEAVQFGKKLLGTKYGSIYSEAVFMDILEKNRFGDRFTLFNSEEYFPVYMDAYIGSMNNAWLRNCALLYLIKGSYENAASLKPDEVVDARDAYFWALTMYDSKRFADCINYLETSEKLLKNKTNKKEKALGAMEIALLEGDSYTQLKDQDSAEQIRKRFIESLTNENGSWILPDSSESENAQVIFTNSARWSLDNYHEEVAQKYLTFAVTQWPDYVPALSLYANFAYTSNLENKKNLVELQLSDSGITTLEMERFDNRVKIPLSDAIARIYDSLERTNDPLLYLIALDLKYKTSNDLNQKQKTADLWNILEKNAVSPSVYPEMMMDYALSYLLKNGENDEAWALYYKYAGAKYGIPLDDFFFENLISKVHEIDSVTLEYGSYFASLMNRGDDALALYELLVFENNSFSDVHLVSPLATDYSCVNLSMIYSSMGMKDKALDLYGKAFGRTANLKLKSEIMRRMAEIYFARKDYKNARRSAEYSLTLNKNNVESRLLLNKIKVSN